MFRRRAMVVFAGLVAVAVFIGGSCRRQQSANRPNAVEIDGSYSVPGLEGCRHRPLVVLSEADAWAGSPEGLPTRTVYEDGFVITAEREDGGRAAIRSGRLDATIELARWLETIGLGALPPRVEVSRATDQPEVTICYRIERAWRCRTVVGLQRSGEITARQGDPSPAFIQAYVKLRDLSLREARVFERDTFRVTLLDAAMSPGVPSPWPDGVPAPPPLVPDERYLGRPRSYVASGEAGARLYAFAGELRMLVRTPSGEPLAVHVTPLIPEQTYIEKVEKCARWEVEPYHECRGD